VRCPACRTTNAIDLRALDRHRDAALSSLIPALSCRSCRPNARAGAEFFQSNAELCRFSIFTAFLADILALEGEDVNAIREGVRGVLADCEQLFRAQEVNKRMKDMAAHACHSLCRARVVEKIRLHKGTPTAEHLKLVLSIIDGPHFP
jgi:hypothetical protein